MSSNEEARRKKKRNEEIKAKLKNMSKEAIQAAISKKKECNARALDIVQQLIEPNVEELWLLDNLKHINQCHFQDIVEERAITMCCGYPLCDRELSNVPKKIYKISTRENKVYDITDRKNYCSNVCYKASIFLKDQLYTSPLWLRDCEVPVEYKILSSKLRGISGSGAEIDLGVTAPVKLSKEHEPVSSDGGKTQKASDDGKTQKVCDDDDSNKTNKEDSLKYKSPSTHGCIAESSPDEKVKESNVKEIEIKIEKEEKSKSNTSLKQSDTVNSQRDRSSCHCLKKEKPQKPPEDIVLGLEKKVQSWVTVDTLMFLLGENGVKDLLKLNGTTLEDLQSLRSKDTQMYEKYQEIFQKVNLLELKEEQEGKSFPSKPLPDYKQLQEEAKKLELKVRSFFKGDGKVTFEEEVSKSDGDEKLTEDQYPVLPLIDHFDVILTRRRILLDKLNRVLPDIQSALELSQVRLGPDLQQLVATFSLGPSNICLHTAQWALVSLIIIKLLTLRNDILNYAYSKELTQKRLITLLLTYDLDGGYIDRLTSSLIDIDNIGSISPF